MKCKVDAETHCFGSDVAPIRGEKLNNFSSMKRFVLAITLLFSLLSCCFLFSSPAEQSPVKEALFYDRLENKSVQCGLCPRMCLIPDGKRGFCGVRENQNGRLVALSFAKAVSFNDRDPIEKKPLFHFLPSTRTFSVATAGCNLRCKFCQNWEISQKRPEEVRFVYLEPADLVRLARDSGAPTIAYTYSEPTIFYEYMLQTAVLAKEAGLKNAMHSNGYINPEPLRKLAQYLDAANIDLKGFTEDYYAQLAEGRLAPVLASLRILKEAGVHVEITNLILSGYNDDDDSLKRMCVWIKENLGADTPVHFSRAFPMYQLTSINPTPVGTLERARDIAMQSGLRYVYVGNVAGHVAENTYCPKCKKVLIERKGYFIAQNNIEDGGCKFCGEKISGIWK